MAKVKEEEDGNALQQHEREHNRNTGGDSGHNSHGNKKKTKGSAGAGDSKHSTGDDGEDEWRSKYANLVIAPADRGQSDGSASDKQSEGRMSLSSLSTLESRSTLPVS